MRFLGWVTIILLGFACMGSLVGASFNMALVLMGGFPLDMRDWFSFLSGLVLTITWIYSFLRFTRKEKWGIPLALCALVIVGIGEVAVEKWAAKRDFESMSPELQEELKEYKDTWGEIQ